MERLNRMPGGVYVGETVTVKGDPVAYIARYQTESSRRSPLIFPGIGDLFPKERAAKNP